MQTQLALSNGAVTKDTPHKVHDISATAPYPFNKLSTFSDSRFVIDGVACKSVESFLQALKYRNVDEQRRVCSMSPSDAAFYSVPKRDWMKTRTLWWNGQSYNRMGTEYQDLLDKVFASCLLANGDYRIALRAIDPGYITCEAKTKHRDVTTLTDAEFVSRIIRMHKAVKSNHVSAEFKLEVQPAKSRQMRH